MNPIKVLEEHLYKYEQALEKSSWALHNGKITPELHRIHKTNNEPKIRVFKKAIAVLLENGFEIE
jgi:hypothetical protein